MRQIVLDTETTGLEPSQGHRIIEVGAVEMINQRLTNNNFHQYLNPQREIDEAAIEIHGITNQQLQDKPSFEEIATELMEYIKDAELIIHNAPFDIGFLNNEFKICGYGDDAIGENCEVLDTLAMARQKHPGQKNSLEALCQRYAVDDTQRTLHGALLDAEILADVYLQMTGGQSTLLDDTENLTAAAVVDEKIDLADGMKIPVIKPSAEELAQHNKWMELLRSQSAGAVWDKFSN